MRLGRDQVAFVEVRQSDTRVAALAAFNAAVLRVAEMKRHMIAGFFDDLLKVRTGNMAACRAVLAGRVCTLPYVASTSTHVAMQAVKQDGLRTRQRAATVLPA